MPVQTVQKRRGNRRLFQLSTVCQRFTTGICPTLVTPTNPSNINPDNSSTLHWLSVGTVTRSVAVTAAAMPIPPRSTMVPLTVRSSSPRPPSVMVKVAVLPDSTRLFGKPAASVYQCGELSDGVGPYFQYCAPAANAGWATPGSSAIMVVVSSMALKTPSARYRHCCSVRLPGRGAHGRGHPKRA